MEETKKNFWSQIGLAMHNQSKIGNPYALDDFESEGMWISDLQYDVSFSLYEGSKVTDCFFEMGPIIENATLLCTLVIKWRVVFTLFFIFYGLAGHFWEMGLFLLWARSTVQTLKDLMA